MRSISILLVLALGGGQAMAAVTIATATDDASLDVAARRSNAETMRRALVEAVGSVRGPARQLDASIVALRVDTVGTRVEVSVALRVAICDGRGQLMAVVSGTATVAARQRDGQLAELRREAIENAVRSAARSLRGQLA